MQVKNDFSIATIEDVHYCYRLFWQQLPDAEGLKFWKYRLGFITLRTLIDYFVDHENFRLYYLNRGQATIIDLPHFKICVHMRDWAVGSTIAIHKIWEPAVTEEMQKHLKPGQTVLDLGANIGYFTLLAAAFVGKVGKVISFEPNPENCDLIRQSVGVNQFTNVELHPNAVADREDELFLDWDINTTHSNSLVKSEPNLLKRVPIRTVVLDRVLENELRIDLLKIDVEGWEGLALRGMTQTLKRHRPLIFTGFFPGMIERFSGIKGQTYLEEIKRIGYKFVVLPQQDKTLTSLKNAQKIMMYWEKVGSPVSHLDLVAYPE